MNGFLNFLFSDGVFTVLVMGFFVSCVPLVIDVIVNGWNPPTEEETEE